ncbi:hypothetical protein ACFU6I_46985 [Streptomyces sp. NPDC057486]|uniref:hypothetical protein n=1 Tax=Streptomyces sp. NPDC057486 TaxID=3346145 RepID=UPI00369BEE1E
MNDPGYAGGTTALLVADPCNDFLSEGGKLRPRTKGVAEQVGLLDHMRQVLAAARASRMPGRPGPMGNVAGRQQTPAHCHMDGTPPGWQAGRRVAPHRERL